MRLVVTRNRLLAHDPCWDAREIESVVPERADPIWIHAENSAFWAVRAAVEKAALVGSSDFSTKRFASNSIGEALDAGLDVCAVICGYDGGSR